MGNKFGKKKKKGATDSKKGVDSPAKAQSAPVIPPHEKTPINKKLSARLDSSPSLLNNIKSKYKLGRKLGKGHFAIVQLGVIKKTKEQVAVKVIKLNNFYSNQESAAAEKQRKTLKKEIDILQQVGQHENITSIFDVYLTKTELHIVMELCEGGELFDRLVSNGPYSEESARQHMHCICDALKFLHNSKIIHRDLKPENIMLKTKDPESSLRIADFGLGKVIDEKVRLATTVCGTWAYTAPEVTKRLDYDYKADMFSFGVILFIVLSAYHPFDPEVGASDAVIIRRAQLGKYDFEDEEWNAISNEGKDLIKHLLEVDPKKRYSAEETLNHPWMKSKRTEEPITCGMTRHRGVSIDEGLRNFKESSQRWRSAGDEILKELSVLKHMKSFGSSTAEILRQEDSSLKE
jgi:serine/threonine protein kinase